MTTKNTTPATPGAKSAPPVAVEKKLNSDYPKILITVLAVVTIFIYRRANIELRWEEIALLSLALVPWLSSFFESFKLGKDGIEWVSKKIEEAATEIKEQVKTESDKISTETNEKLNETNEKLNETNEKLNEVKESNEITRTVVTSGAGGGKIKTEERNRLEEAIKGAINPDDPQKGQWGGKLEDNNRKISARVEVIPNENYLRRVIFTVESTNERDVPLKDTVTFYLHPTFRRPVMDVNPVDGVAELQLIAYGAFTAGAVTDHGQTTLEFDLKKELDDHKDPFFTR